MRNFIFLLFVLSFVNLHFLPLEASLGASREKVKARYSFKKGQKNKKAMEELASRR